MVYIPRLQIGTTVIVQKKIEREDTALKFGSGKLDNLLATPTLVALAIEAAVKAVDDKLPEGFVTAAKYLEISHDQPTIMGMTVSVKAVLKVQEGNNLIFDVEAFDEVGVIGRGKFVRTIVNKNSLIGKAKERAFRLESINF